jgi:hypothetical protein
MQCCGRTQRDGDYCPMSGLIETGYRKQEDARAGVAHFEA